MEREGDGWTERLDRWKGREVDWLGREEEETDRWRETDGTGRNRYNAGERSSEE